MDDSMIDQSLLRIAQWVDRNSHILWLYRTGDLWSGEYTGEYTVENQPVYKWKRVGKKHRPHAQWSIEDAEKFALKCNYFRTVEVTWA